MKFLFTTAIAMFLSLPLMATEQTNHSGVHTPNACLADKSVCAHLMFPKTPNSTDESQFIAHFLTQENVSLSQVHAILWMDDMGHGSAPVEIIAKDNSHYLIKNAYFIMPGQWQVKLKFNANDVAQELIIPVLILE